MYTRVVSLLCFEACVRKGFLKSVLRGAIGAKRANCNIVRTYEQQTVKVICRGCCCCCSHESIVVDALLKGLVKPFRPMLLGKFYVHIYMARRVGPLRTTHYYLNLAIEYVRFAHYDIL